MTRNLNNTATTHALTSIDPYNADGEPEELPYLFTFNSRYNAETFQGIMPYAGAAAILTAEKHKSKYYNVYILVLSRNEMGAIFIERK